MPIEFVATSKLPTKFGEFKISVFQDPETGEEHVALSKGLETPPDGPVLVVFTLNVLLEMPLHHLNAIAVHNYRRPSS